jgi:ribosomal protein L14
MRGRTGVMAAVAMCLVAGSAWAQSGPQQVATRPGQVTARVISADAQLKLRRIPQPVAPATLVAKQGWKTVAVKDISPLRPDGQWVRMSASSALTVDNQSPPRGFYMFSPQAHQRRVTDYAQIQITAKRGYLYDLMCYSTYVDNDGLQMAQQVNLVAAKYEGGVMRSGGLVKSESKQSGPNAMTVHMVAYQHDGANGAVTLRIMTNQTPANATTLFYGCFVGEAMPTTTYVPQGDKA